MLAVFVIRQHRDLGVTNFYEIFSIYTYPKSPKSVRINSEGIIKEMVVIQYTDFVVRKDEGDTYALASLFSGIPSNRTSDCSRKIIKSEDVFSVG